jgi:hypothetical protein
VRNQVVKDMDDGEMAGPLPTFTSGESNARRQRQRRHRDVPAARKRVRNQVVKDMDNGEMAGPVANSRRHKDKNLDIDGRRR